MANLKEIRTRIQSIKETQKITSAMKMVATARLRRAQEQLEQHKEYHAGLLSLARRVLMAESQSDATNPMLSGVLGSRSHLIILVTPDRGLCGGFNTSLTREAIKLAHKYRAQHHRVSFYCVGRYGKEQLSREFEDAVIQWDIDLSREASLTPKALNHVSDRVLQCVEQGGYETVYGVYGRFKNMITQELTVRKLIPSSAEGEGKVQGEYILEPNTEYLLKQLVPYIFKVQIHHMLLEGNASEHGARMTAMDNATRNAQDVIHDLEITYNRTRQAMITKELIEIISGSEAL